MDWKGLTELWAPWINIGVTFILACLTAGYVWLTRQMLRAHTKPFVNIGLDRDDANGMIFLVLRNDGLGPAYDVKTEVPQKFRESSPPRPGDFTRGPVGAGVPVLGPRDKVRQAWAHERELLEWLGERNRYEVTIEWSERRGGKVVRSPQQLSISAVDPIRFTQPRTTGST